MTSMLFTPSICHSYQKNNRNKKPLVAYTRATVINSVQQDSSPEQICLHFEIHRSGNRNVCGQMHAQGGLKGIPMMLCGQQLVKSVFKGLDEWVSRVITRPRMGPSLGFVSNVVVFLGSTSVTYYSLFYASFDLYHAIGGD